MNNFWNRNTSIDSYGCPSHVYFGDTPYTLSFGQLFSGNLNDDYHQRPKCYVKTSRNYSIPSVPYCYNPMMSNSNQSNMTKAAELLEQAANVISIKRNIFN